MNNHLTILRRILILATEWGVLTHTPPVKWLKVPEPEFDFLDFDEAARLEKGATGERAAMITVGLTTGLRQGEPPWPKTLHRESSIRLGSGSRI